MFLVTTLPLRVVGEIKAALCRSPALWFGTEGGMAGVGEGGRAGCGATAPSSVWTV